MKTKQMAKSRCCSVCQGEVTLCPNCAAIYEKWCWQSQVAICLSCNDELDSSIAPLKKARSGMCAILFRDDLKRAYWCKDGRPVTRSLGSLKFDRFDPILTALSKSGVELPTYR